jgi:Tubulin folding cofactor D C terminal
MRFLEVPEYRPTVLSGLLISVGSRTDNTVMNHAVTGGENTRTLTIVFVSDATSEIVLLRTQTNFRRMLVTVDTIIYKPSSTV